MCGKGPRRSCPASPAGPRPCMQPAQPSGYRTSVSPPGFPGLALGTSICARRGALGECPCLGSAQGTCLGPSWLWTLKSMWEGRPLRQRAEVLCTSLVAGAETLGSGPNTAGGLLLDLCCALIPLGDWYCAGLLAEPCFAAQAKMAQLAPHSPLPGVWTQASVSASTPASTGGGTLLDGLLPGRGALVLPPYTHQPRQARAPGVCQAVEQRLQCPREGRRTVGLLCLEHKLPSCSRCQLLRWGITRHDKVAKRGTAGSRLPRHAMAQGIRCCSRRRTKREQQHCQLALETMPPPPPHPPTHLWRGRNNSREAQCHGGRRRPSD